MTVPPLSHSTAHPALPTRLAAGVGGQAEARAAKGLLYGGFDDFPQGSETR